MSPRVQSLVPVAEVAGDAFPVTGLTRSNISATLTYRTLVAVTNTGVAGTVMSIWQVPATAAPIFSTFTVPSVSGSGGGETITAGRAMKAGLSLVNTTQLLNRGGRVFYLNSTARLFLPNSLSGMSNGNLLGVMDAICSHPKCQAYDGTDFSKPLEFAAEVVDTTAYHQFNSWEGSETSDEFWTHISTYPGSAETTRPMSALFIVIDSTSVQQTYTATAYGSWYTRWPVESILGQAQRPIPVAPQAVVNKVHATGKALASGPHSLSDLGVVAGLTAAAIKYGPRVARRAGAEGAFEMAEEAGILAGLL